MPLNKKSLALFTASMLTIGGMGAVGIQAFAQSSPPNTPPMTSAVSSTTDPVDVSGAPDATDTEDQEGTEHQGKDTEVDVKDANEAPGTEANDGPRDAKDEGETEQN